MSCCSFLGKDLLAKFDLKLRFDSNIYLFNSSLNIKTVWSHFFLFSFAGYCLKTTTCLECQAFIDISYKMSRWSIKFISMFIRKLLCCVILINFSECNAFLPQMQPYLSQTPLRYSTLGNAPGLIHKQHTRLEKLRSSLVRTFVNYGRKNYAKNKVS